MSITATGHHDRAATADAPAVYPNDERGGMDGGKIKKPARFLAPASLVTCNFRLVDYWNVYRKLSIIT